MKKTDTEKQVKVFGWASFFNDMGSDMIYAVWPLFITSFLGAPMYILGIIDGLGDAIVSISQAISGHFSDKYKKRKIFVWVGYLLGAISRIGYAFSFLWQHALFFRALDRSGKMRGAPRDAIVADLSSDKNRGKNFGILRSMDHLGAVFGIVLSIYLFKTLGFRKLFLVATIPSLISVILILVFVKERKAPEKKVYKGLSLKNLSREFKIFLLSSSFFAFGAFSYSFLLIYAKDFSFSVAEVPVLYLTLTVVASITSIPFGKLADKIGRKKVIYLSYFFWISTLLLFIFSQSKLILFLGFIMYGLHKGALEPVQKAFVAELSPNEFKASSLGGFQMVMGIMALPASLIAGILWDGVGIVAPLYFSIGLTLISIILLPFVHEKKLFINNKKT